MTEPDVTHPKPPLLPPAYFLLCLIGGATLHIVFPSTRIVTGPYRWLAVIPFQFSGLLVLWANLVFRRRGTTVVPNQEPTALVTTGPFRFSRHPMYLSLAMLLTAIAIALGSLVMFLAPVAFVLIMNNTFIPYEERKMARIFGDEYVAYKRLVRRWL